MSQILVAAAKLGHVEGVFPYVLEAMGKLRKVGGQSQVNILWATAVLDGISGTAWAHDFDAYRKFLGEMDGREHGKQVLCQLYQLQLVWGLKYQQQLLPMELYAKA